MVKTKPATYRIPVPMLARMKMLTKATGIRPSEQVRRALEIWVAEKEKFQASLVGSLKGGR